MKRTTDFFRFYLGTSLFVVTIEFSTWVMNERLIVRRRAYEEGFFNFSNKPCAVARDLVIQDSADWSSCWDTDKRISI